MQLHFLNRTVLTTGGDRSFVKAASVLWNHLPLALKLTTTLDHFKSGLNILVY